MGIRGIFCLLALAGAARAIGAAPPAFPERKVFQFGPFTIEASAGDESYVEALAVQLVAFKIPAPAAPQDTLPLSLADLAARRDHFLTAVASFIGLAAPTPKMIAAYGRFVGLWRDVHLVQPNGLPHRFSLWRRPELLARVQAGQKIPGFSLAASNLSFDFNFNVDYKDSDPREIQRKISALWDTMVWPVKIPDHVEGSPADVMRQSLAQTVGGFVFGFSQALDGTQAMQVFNVLHETTETGVVWTYLTSKDRRWFCDGVANYVAWRVLESEVGPDRARLYYDLPEQMKRYHAQAPEIDLAAWPAVENLAGYPEDLNSANYAFATKVIADVCARYGDDFLPRLFHQIGRTPREKATMKTVFKAFRKLTGEDLHDYLPKRAVSR